MTLEQSLQRLAFTVLVRPVPQGSMKGYPIRRKNGKMGVVLTSDNTKLKPYRGEVTRAAWDLVNRSNDLFAGKHVPIRLTLNFFLKRPISASKKRMALVVKPDLSKLLRATEDALTGVLYADDAQIVEEHIFKAYGMPERVEILLEIL